MRKNLKSENSLENTGYRLGKVKPTYYNRFQQSLVKSEQYLRSLRHFTAVSVLLGGVPPRARPYVNPV